MHEIAVQIVWLTTHMCELSIPELGCELHCSRNTHTPEKMMSYYSVRHFDREGELSRLVLVLITPDPTTGARSASASVHGQAYYKELAKDTLICALDALAQSSDAFPPLKSAAGGLMFFANWADVSTQLSSR